MEHGSDHEQEYNQDGRYNSDNRDGEGHNGICTTGPGDSEPSEESANVADDSSGGHDFSREIIHDNTVRQGG